MSVCGQMGFIFGQAYVIGIAHLWGKGVHALLSWIVGATYEIRGQELWDGKPALIACKHESALETSAIQMLCYNAAIVLKKELTWIPFFGHSTKIAGVIPINRSKGKSVLPQIVEGAKGFFDQGRCLFLFPEGTRRDPHAPTSLRPGIATLYEELGVPVYPIALNTGLIWGRRSFIKHPGKIIYEFLPPIMPGLSKQAFLERLTHDLEEARVRIQKEVKGITPKPRLSNALLFTMGAFLVVSLLYTGLWHWGAQKIEAQVNEISRNLQKDNITLSYVHESTQGFPFSIQVTLSQVHLQHPLGHASCDGKVHIGANVFTPLRWHWQAQGKTTLASSTDARRIESASMTGSVDLTHAGVYDLIMAQPRLLGKDSSTLLEAQNLHLTHSQQTNTKEQTLSLDITHPKGDILPVADAQRLYLKANLNHPLSSLSTQSLSAWQKDGGVLDITDFHLKAPPLDLTAQATLTLDKNLQPEGAASLYATGVNPFLDGLVEKGSLSFLTAQGYKLAFHLATSFSQKKGVAQKDGVTAVSMSIQDGTLSLGQTPLLPVPSITWGT